MHYRRLAEESSKLTHEGEALTALDIPARGRTGTSLSRFERAEAGGDCATVLTMASDAYSELRGHYGEVEQRVTSRDGR